MAQMTRQFFQMGTVITVTIVSDQAAPLLTAIGQQLQEYEHRFSANDVTSELYLLAKNAGKSWTVVKPQLYELIDIGKAYSLLPNNNLNIAIGPLVQTWRIGFSDARVPTAPAIARALALIDPRQIQLDPQQSAVYLTQAGMQLDLGALAKGYIADLLLGFLKEKQVQRALINLGGNVVTFAQPGQNYLWQVGLRDPQGQATQVVGTVALGNQSLVTSGIYERQLRVAGRTYHHIFDERTGYPIATEVASLSIKSTQSVVGELWTTMLFGKTAAEILAIVATMPEIECCLIMRNGDIRQSAGFNLQLKTD